MSKTKQKVTRDLFATVLAKGRIYHSPHLSFRIHTTSQEETSAFSFVVSKKVARLAVSRNRLKRRGRSVIKKIEHCIHKPYIGAFFFKKGSVKISFQELEEEILQLLKKAKVL